MSGKEFSFPGLIVIAANLAILITASALLYKRSISEE